MTAFNPDRNRLDEEREEVIAGLNDLLQLDHDAVSAYEIAIDRLDDREHALHIESFRRDHQRHIRELNDLILAMGGVPTNEPHASAPLKEAIQKIAASSGDKGLLTAFRANEFQISTQYDGYAQEAQSWPPEAKRLVDQNALDEERHYSWVSDLLGSEDPAEVHAANRYREAKVQVEVGVDDVKNKARDASTRARFKVADGLEGAASYLHEVAERGRAENGVKAKAASGADRLSTGLGRAAAGLRSQSAGGEDSPGIAERVTQQIQNHPLRTVGITFGVAFVLGRVFRSGGGKRNG